MPPSIAPNTSPAPIQSIPVQVEVGKPVLDQKDSMAHSEQESCHLERLRGQEIQYV
ncbi:hypothetical protein scyTo_0026672, partial [Scyliorhinus torazame]|nr:hypothetical protein [Scyliorhinus torazame]